MLGLITLISIACCFILLSLPLMMVIKVTVILCVILSSIYFCLRDALLMLPNSWQFLDIDTKGNLKIVSRRGQLFEPILADSSFIHNHMILLNFKRRGFKLALPPAILFTTKENADNLRRLRVWLRWGKPSKLNQEDLVEAAEVVEAKG